MNMENGNSDNYQDNRRRPMRASLIFGPLILSFLISFVVEIIFYAVVIIGATTSFIAESPEVAMLIESANEAGTGVSYEELNALLTDEVVDEILVEAAVSAEQNIALFTVMGALFSIPIFLWMLHRDRRKMPFLGGMQITKLPTLYYGFIVLGSVALCVALNNLITLSQLAETSQAYQESSESLYSIRFSLQLLAWGIVTPISEEILFRGVLHNRIRNYLRPIAAMVWSALIFGIYHGNLVSCIYAMLCGFVFAWLYEKYGSIKAPILAHICMNITSLVLTQYDFFIWMFEDPMRMTIITVLAASVAATAYVMLQNMTREEAIGE